MKNRHKNYLKLLLMTVWAILAFSSVSFAAEDTATKIERVTLKVDKSDYADTGYIDVTTSYGNYGVEDVKVNGRESNGTVRVRVELTADDDYVFGSLTASKVTLQGDKAKFSSSTLSNHKQTAYVNLVVAVSKNNDDPYVPSWNTDWSNMWNWNWENNTTNNGTHKLDPNAPKITYYQGTAIATLPKNGPDAGNGGSGNNTGWKQDSRDWYYIGADGKRVTNGWSEINGNWYCFDKDGYIRVGWIQNGDHWYYCDASYGNDRGKMLKNTRTPDGYYVNERGLYIPGV